MTILIGVLCQDGVVIGTDSSATFIASQIRTIEQKCKKIEIIDNEAIIAGSGPIGLCQRFKEIIGKQFAGGHYRNKSHFDIAKTITTTTLNDFSSTFAPQGQFGALVAFATKNTFHLCEFDSNTLQPEFKTDIWYVSMGSGQIIADPFLGFIRRVFWRDNKPHLQDGVFAVTWALDHAIELNPGGINGPSQIAILKRDADNKFGAQLLSEDDLAEHRDNVKGIEKYLSKYKNAIREGKSDKPIPEIPKTT